MSTAEFSFLAKLYEAGHLNPEQRAEFEANLLENEDALNALDSYYSAFSATRPPLQVKEYNVAEIEFRPVPIPGAIMQAAPAQQTSALSSWLKQLSAATSSLLSPEKRSYLIPVATAAMVMIVIVPKLNEGLNVDGSAMNQTLISRGGPLTELPRVHEVVADDRGALSVTWEPVQGVKEYTISLYDKDHAEVFFQGKVTRAPFVIPSGDFLKAGQTYHAKVSFVSKEGKETWNQKTFTFSGEKGLQHGPAPQTVIAK